MAEYSYPDKLGFGETLMFTLRVMANELATDGLEEQYEDLVDHLCFIMSPFIKEADKIEEWDEVEEIGQDLDREKDLTKWSKAKRERVRKKMIMCMDLMQKHKLLLRRHQTYGTEFDYSSIPIDKKGR